jgi:hypothetical protein
MSTTRHLIEHLAPLVFGAILGWLSIDFKPEHAEHWVLAFVVLFLIYSAIFEVLKRLLLFRLSQKRKVCGVYAEVYSREAGSVVVAPLPGLARSRGRPDARIRAGVPRKRAWH